ncbi:hypothetical protein NGB36_28240 [Streptomyces sp. RB6PN25]|uniref:Uncharacterized protein n=1 Tax=Streptomyces humicola TaxID=2953240 RepID=A0ABT1Q365_9ACTN|nr:hypothetical protein [Streptomyces humicola]
MTAVLAAVVHLVWPHIRFDAITVTLLVIAIIPWLGEIFDSITLPGGAGVQFRKLTARVEEAEAATARLEREVEGAADTSQVALTAAQEHTAGELAADPAETVDRLAADYLALRQSLPAGTERTRLMQQVFGELVRETARIPDPPIASWLESENGGLRLAAYTRLFLKPDPQYLEALLDAVIKDDFAFNVSRGIRALENVIDIIGPAQIRVGTVHRLRMYFGELPEGNRKKHLRRLLDRFPELA